MLSLNSASAIRRLFRSAPFEHCAVAWCLPFSALQVNPSNNPPGKWQKPHKTPKILTPHPEDATYVTSTSSVIVNPQPSSSLFLTIRPKLHKVTSHTPQIYPNLNQPIRPTPIGPTTWLNLTPEKAVTWTRPLVPDDPRRKG